MKDYRIIDMHSHFNHSDSNGAEVDELNKCDFDFLHNEGKNMGVEKMAFSSFDCILHKELSVPENEYLYNYCQVNDWAYQWIVIDPENEETFNQALKYINNPKCLGLKIHPMYHKYNILQYADKIFKFANDNKMIVLFHPDMVDEVVEIVNKYPDMDLIIAHLGYDYHINAIKNSMHKNIYVDTCGFRGFFNNVLEHTVKEVGSNRILYGSDTYSQAAEIGRITYSSISDEDKENILYNNAIKLFNKHNKLLEK